MRRLALLLILGGCFDPTFQPDLACAPDRSCPPDTSCRSDNRCHPLSDLLEDAPITMGLDGAPDAPARDGNSLDARPDAPADASPFDAVPPDARGSCSSNEDCVTPPDMCSVAGTCNTTTKRCTYPARDCSGVADQCNTAGCNPTTGCVKVPAFEGNSCGAGHTCGSYGPCEGFDSTCDSTGTQTRPCDNFTCKGGTCSSTPSTESQGCTRATNGNPCGTTDQTCSACVYEGGVCDESGTQDCTCTDHTCSNDVCVDTQRSCGGSCSRNTDGDVCGAACCGGSLCPETRDKCCSAGACTQLCGVCGA